MRIFNNLPATKTFNALNRTNKILAKTLNSLSTGLRINSSSDDAAGFAISQKMRSQISGLNVAMRNSQDGISLLQTAEGALGETNSMLQRMRELAVQASNDSLTSNDRQYIQLEIDELKEQIDKIANTTQFNKKKILDGSSGALWSSSDINVKARINGGLTRIDEFGQKVSSEGNYRIEISVEGGQAQIQKSNIMNVAYYKSVTKTITGSEAIISQEPIYENRLVGWNESELVEDTNMEWKIILNGGTNGEAVNGTVKEAANEDEINSGWSFSDNTLTIKENGTYHITSNGTTKNRIVVDGGVEANIFLDNVNINVSSDYNACAFCINDNGKANVYLIGNNYLSSGANRAGLEVSPNASVMICSAEGLGSTEGYLSAVSVESTNQMGFGGAGIGGSGNYKNDGKSGEIVINGGTIIARGYGGGAGIGGGNTSGSDSTKITINGGDITAYGGASHISTNSAGGAGIGGGFAHTTIPVEINIAGGSIKAYGAGSNNDPKASRTVISGAGIGGGGGINSTTGGRVKISNTLRNSIVAVPGDGRAEAIGRGAGDRGVYTVEYVDFQPVTVNVPDLPSATIQTPAVIREPVYENVIVGYKDVIIGYNETEKEITTNDFTMNTLSNISQFNAPGEGEIIAPYKTLKITQGNGKTANITLYENDTIYDAAKKINDAIANSLGQKKYTDKADKFCTISNGTENTSESVYERTLIYDDDGNFNGYEIKATMLIRSAIPGKAGELYFSGDQELLNAFGLNTIQSSSESTFTVSVREAHSGKIITSDKKITGNIFHGIINPNIDVEFDSISAIRAVWNEKKKNYVQSDKSKYTAFLHIKDNDIMLQIGANNGEDLSIKIGDSSSNALGISELNVMTRETASRAITMIDNALDKVLSERAKIGAYENLLEHRMEILASSEINLTDSESRIRDADMAKTMMNFVKLQILNQSGTSMLAQSNQLPNSVLKLMQ